MTKPERSTNQPTAIPLLSTDLQAVVAEHPDVLVEDVKEQPLKREAVQRPRIRTGSDAILSVEEEHKQESMRFRLFVSQE